MINKFYKLTAAILVGFLLSTNLVWAVCGLNTHSITLAKASSQYLQATDSASLSPTGSTTIEFYTKLVSAPGTGVGTPIVFKGDYNTDNAYQVYYMNTAGLLSVNARIFASSGNTNFITSSLAYTLPVGSWSKRVSVVIRPNDPTATKFEWYLDGVSQGNGTTTLVGTVAAIYDSGVDLGIGQSIPAVPVADYYLDGKIDDIRIWGKARTASEILGDYNVQLAGNETNLNAYWQLNNALTDLTSNGNTLTNNGSAAFSTDVPFAGSSCSTFSFSQLFGW